MRSVGDRAVFGSPTLIPQIFHFPFLTSAQVHCCLYTGVVYLSQCSSSCNYKEFWEIVKKMLEKPKMYQNKLTHGE
jgi:hypothetical protein